MCLAYALCIPRKKLQTLFLIPWLDFVESSSGYSNDTGLQHVCVPFLVLRVYTADGEQNAFAHTKDRAWKQLVRNVEKRWHYAAIRAD